MDYSGYRFGFERLEVYRRALGFSFRVFDLTLGFKKEIQYSLGDQFRWAALSICNNIADGSRKSFKGRKQFYDYALDSARECDPMISLAARLKQIDSGTESMLRSECVQICNMVYKLGTRINR